jgi:uncharacterized protein YkwD
MAVSRRGFMFAIAFAYPLGHQAPPGSAAAADVAAEIEWHIRFLTNQERLWQKLATLELSPALADVARAHSRDMLARGFFAHVNPEGQSPKDRVLKQGLTYGLVAENIYSMRDGTTDAAAAASIMVKGWMKNDGHRKNILEPRLGQIGVGVAMSAREVLATQLFGA